MRTLNRPMFRYGGPIKEGVMDGIREPKRNGGSMLQSVQPSNNGMRPGYKGIPNPKKIKSDIIVGGTKNIVRKYAPQLEGIGGRTINKLKNFYNKNTTKIPKYTTADGGIMYTQTPMLQRIKQFAQANKKQTAAGAYIASPAVVGAASSIPYKKAGMQILDLAVPDFIFDQDEYVAKKAKEKLNAEKNNTVNTDLKKLLEQPVKPKKSEKEIRAEQIAKYRDIVDIKGMSKDAAYDSLIAASQAISGEGDFKGSLKDGSLINKIIGSTSKAFDKPKATKDAIDTLILKGEIEKDMNKDKNAIMDTYRMKQIALADKQLAGGDFSENKALFAKNMSGQQLFDSAAAKSSPNFMGNLINKKGLTDLMTEAKKSGDIVERDIIITATEELIKGKGVPNGDYTVGDVLVTIVEGKVANVTR